MVHYSLFLQGKTLSSELFRPSGILYPGSAIARKLDTLFCYIPVLYGPFKSFRSGGKQTGKDNENANF